MPGVFENDHAAVRSHDLHLLPQQCFVAFSPSIARTGMVSLVLGEFCEILGGLLEGQNMSNCFGLP
jgi:hypothetical protein